MKFLRRASENEVVRDAVRRMREEEERIARFQATVRIGDEQIERGETVPYSKELMEQIGQRAVQRARQGKKIDNPDVLPCTLYAAPLPAGRGGP